MQDLPASEFLNQLRKAKKSNNTAALIENELNDEKMLHSQMFCGMSLIFLQGKSACNVSTIKGKKSLKQNLKLRMERKGRLIVILASLLLMYIITNIFY